MAFKPMTPFATPMILLIPITVTTSTQPAYGVATKTYPGLARGEQIFGTFRTFGGSDSVENGVLSIVDTATIDTWYRSDITSGCRIAIAETREIYEVVGSPEDIELRHQYLRIRVQRVKGGV